MENLTVSILVVNVTISSWRPAMGSVDVGAACLPAAGTYLLCLKTEKPIRPVWTEEISLAQH